MRLLSNWIQDEGRLIVTQPLSQSVPARSDYAQTEGLAHLGKRVLARKLYLLLTGQLTRLRAKVDSNWSKGIWIYERTSQIGDSLMDLAPRSVFKEFGCEIDLLCTEKISEVFKNDTWFRHVYSEPRQAARNEYAFVIIQSVHHRSLKKKVKYFKELPWVCIQGYYDVPDFARADFGAQRLIDLWSRGQDRLASNLSAHAKQKITYAPIEPHRHQFNVTIVLGGMNDVRTYSRWSEVLMHAQLPETTQITLVGTGPVAQLHAIELTTRFSELLLHDRVNQTGINEVKSILTKTDLLVCADGGLMHLGAACDVPSIVALFIRDIPPEYRLPKQYHGGAITSDTLRVQDIAPEAIGNKINLECGRLLATAI